MNGFVGITKAEVEQYMHELGRGRGNAALSPMHRRKFFNHLLNTAPDFSAKRFQNDGLRGTFGLSDLHRERISESMKASWAKRKGAAA